MSQHGGIDNISGKTPEERELNRKQPELVTLRAHLADRELELATLQAELRVFEVRYLSIIGVRYAELDELEAQIAEAKAHLNRKDSNAQGEVSRARARAQESAWAAGASQEPSQQDKFKPSESLKTLYREVAKCIHPDFATDDEERDTRTHLMAEANRAYEEGDEGRLQKILREWESSPEVIKGEGPAINLVRVIRKIAQVEDRLRDIETEIAELRASELNQLKTKVEVAENEGRGLLVEMAARLDNEIAAARERVKNLTITMVTE